MIKFYFILCLFFCFVNNQLKASVFNDTLTIFQDRRGIECAKDTAAFKIQIFSIGKKIWQRNVVRFPFLDTIQIDRFKDRNLKNLADTSFEYFIGFKKIRIYINGYVYKYGFINRSNGQLMGYEILDKKGNVIEQKGWDSLGHEITNYICQKTASFGSVVYPTWEDYLIQNLDQDLLKKNNAPKKMEQKVVVSFVVDTAGFVRNVSIFPDNIGYGIPEEIARIFYGSPRWSPAIINNQKSQYRQKQDLTFLNP